MSEQELEVVEEIPQEIIELQKTLEKFNNFKNLLAIGTFPGRSAKEVLSLSELIKELYDQTYQRFITHPYYIANVGEQVND